MTLLLRDDRHRMRKKGVTGRYVEWGRLDELETSQFIGRIAGKATGFIAFVYSLLGDRGLVPQRRPRALGPPVACPWLPSRPVLDSRFSHPKQRSDS